MPKKFTFEYIKNQIEKEDYKLLSETYINCMSKLKIQCNKGHIYESVYNNFKNKKRCPICFGNKKLNYLYIKNQIEKEDYKLVSNIYKNAYTKLKIQCDKGHFYKTIWSNWKQGRRCPVCNNESKSSKTEKEIQNYIKSFNLKQINNDRSQIINPLTNHYLELDIYLPELNKAIEYNGTYWHSLSSKIKNDKIKQNECKKLGINLLTIHEKDYINNKQNELNKIKHFIGK